MDAFIKYLEKNKIKECPRVTVEKYISVVEETMSWLENYFSKDVNIYMEICNGEYSSLLKEESTGLVEKGEEILHNKNKDYSGGEASAIRNFEFGEIIVGVRTEIAILSRIMDKLSRVNSLSNILIDKVDEMEKIHEIKDKIDEEIFHLLCTMKSFSDHSLYSTTDVLQCVVRSLSIGSMCKIIKHIMYKLGASVDAVGYVDEKIEDTCVDMANYFILLLTVIKEET